MKTRTKWMTRLAAATLALLFGVGEAAAIIGRPATPMSYAGAARRSARYGAYGGYGGAYGYRGGYGYGYGAGAAAVATGVAVGARYSALPGGCSYMSPYYNCGGLYYQPYYDGPNVTYVSVNP